MRAAATTNGPVRIRLLPLPASLLTLFALLLALFATATPARAADTADTTTSADTQAAYLADRLRENPVYVSDQLPREIPKSTTPDFAKLAERTGVPTYVLVLPGQAAPGHQLLGTVHDRLGKDGLYVLLDETQVADATAYGVDVPADAAATATTYELPYDAGPLLHFERFVDVLTQGEAKAAARAEAAREKYADGSPPDMYITQSDRDSQSFLTGLAMTGTPLLILLLVPYVRRWWRRRPGAARPTPKQERTRLVWLLPAIALATAVAIGVTAPLVFDETRSSASPTPRAVDLNARLDRVTKGLAEDPVYADPESPRVLDARQLTQLHARIEKFRASADGGPVFVAVVPQLYEDESGADEEAFAAALHDKLGKDGVYIVADPLFGMIDVFNYGLRLDSLDLLYDLPESIAYGDAKADRADDHLLGERLDALMTYLDKAERTADPQTPGEPFTSAPDPIAEDDLRPLYYGDFWQGLIIGALAAVALYGVVAAVLGLVRKWLVRRKPDPTPTANLARVSPAAPSESYLRSTAKTELRAMTRDFGTGETADTRARNRYDATMLLAADGLDGLRPGPLVAVIVLARATRSALAHEDVTRCCGVNPLHGPAKSSRHVKVSTEDSRRKMLPLCDRCLNDTHPNDYPSLLLTLPSPDGGPQRIPYYEDDLLAAVPDGFTKLGRTVRESVHVP
ncbi:hypothetical protein [Streptomyces sp. S.PB5]|uniref:hypothetical protein n=1 Tax=Streptomyces sp. S.PB5 TaxID=3020844 RepID=UPI0025AFF78C|nr:hypothetical protein [Streptomyces sp. S.PB5]MDN3024809.1 hypothetical protein [Streptomyces sp. S.PB5]